MEQIVQPSSPGAFFPGHMQFPLQSVDNLQNAAGLGFHNRLHNHLATAVEDRDHDRFLVHVHADILDVATHFSCLLGGKITRRPTESFPQGKVPRSPESSYLYRYPDVLLAFELITVITRSRSQALRCAAEATPRHLLQSSEAGRSFIMHLLSGKTSSSGLKSLNAYSVSQSRIGCQAVLSVGLSFHSWY